MGIDRPGAPEAVSLTEIALALVLLAAVAATVSFRRFPFRGLKPFLEKPCQGRAWRKRFPAAPEDQLRAFLRLQAVCFGIPEAEALHLAPEDRTLDLYCAIYPDPGRADTMELETFHRECLKRYQKDIAELLRQGATLAEIFAFTHAV